MSTKYLASLLLVWMAWSNVPLSLFGHLCIQSSEIETWMSKTMVAMLKWVKKERSLPSAHLQGSTLSPTLCLSCLVPKYRVKFVNPACPLICSQGRWLHSVSWYNAWTVEMQRTPVACVTTVSPVSGCSDTSVKCQNFPACVCMCFASLYFKLLWLYSVFKRATLCYRAGDVAAKHFATLMSTYEL